MTTATNTGNGTCPAPGVDLSDLPNSVKLFFHKVGGVSYIDNQTQPSLRTIECKCNFWPKTSWISNADRLRTPESNPGPPTPVGMAICGTDHGLAADPQNGTNNNNCFDSQYICKSKNRHYHYYAGAGRQSAGLAWAIVVWPREPPQWISFPTTSKQHAAGWQRLVLIAETIFYHCWCSALFWGQADRRSQSSPNLEPLGAWVLGCCLLWSSRMRDWIKMTGWRIVEKIFF